MIDLHSFASNRYSQGGEDGILARLLASLGISRGTFCELGAWDGPTASNTWALHLAGWTGVYIEGDDERFRQLARNVAGSGTEAVHAWVRPTGALSLDALLAETPLAKGPLTVLSIDIDSDDLALWRSLRSHRPVVVVIEYNPTIPIDVLFENPEGETKGNSPRSIYDHAEEHGYDLVAATATNLVFVLAQERPAELEAFRLDDPRLRLGRRFFFGYDGEMVVAETGSAASAPTYRPVLSVPWHRAWMAQPLPRRLRRYELSRRERTVLAAVSALMLVATRPVALAHAIWLQARRGRNRDR